MKNLSNNIIKNICNGRIIFLFLFILGIMLLIGSCSKDEEEEFTATTYLTPTSCTDSEDVSGVITGIRDVNFSGTYSISWMGDTPSGGCISDSTALGPSGYNITSTATDVASLKHQIFVTSSSSFTQTTRLYSDSSCSNLIAFLQQSKKDVTAGDNITIDGSPDGFPPYATRFTNTQSRFCIYGGTTPTNNLLKSWTSGFTLTKGAVTDDAGNASDTVHGLATTQDNVSGSTATWLYIGSLDQSSAPDNFTSEDDRFFSDNVSN
tara:strand:- start:407 stop:1198 length:792 start_codon:yes stop_codon:yes gene_type:complete